MSQADVFRLKEVQADSLALESAKEYKTFITIRRDLRGVDRICHYAIALREQLFLKKQLPDEVAESLFLVKGALMHAVVLYARWFSAVSGEPILKPDMFLATGSAEFQTHKQIMSLRDRYIAHEALDILGTDTVWVNRNVEGVFESTQSDWEDHDSAGLGDLKVESFQRCVHAVHNCIDAKILPDRQRRLDTQLRQLYSGR